MCTIYMFNTASKMAGACAFRLKPMEGTVTGFCLKTDGGVSYLACPFCFNHICPSYFHFQANSAYTKLMIEADSASSSSETDQLDDESLYSSVRSIVGHPYRQLRITRDLFVSCSTFKELEVAGVSGRQFGSIPDFCRLAEDLAWDLPAGLVVMHVHKERSLVFKSGYEPTLLSAYAALCYLRRWTAGGLVLFGNGNIGFLESHHEAGAMHTSIRRMLRLTVESWED